MSHEPGASTRLQPAPAAGADERARVVSPLVGAAMFLLIYLSVSPVTGPLQGHPMPLPGAPTDQVYAYLTSSTGASLATGVLQGLSVLGLAVVLASPLLKVNADGHPAARGRRVLAATAGSIAVVAMLVTVALSVTLGVIAPTATPDLLVTLWNAAFIAGGVVHVVALGVFVGLASRLPGWTRIVAVSGLVAAIPAVLSIASTLWFYASVLLPVGRLLCMLWLVVAGISLLRGRTHLAR